MTDSKLSRRQFLEKTGQGVLGMAALGATSTLRFPTPYLKNPKISNKVVVLGIDGMDPVLLQRFVAEGAMPTFKNLMERGYFGNLKTTLPPQSPVAWSSFITGTNPGGHGIFDFIHRDADTFTPYLSTSRSRGSEKSVDVGKWSIPLKSGKVELLRRGPAFWTFLEEQSIPASLFKLPANFPTTTGNSHQVSGMGTPDLLGTYGTFTYYSDTEVPGSKDFTGGRVVKINMSNHSTTTKLVVQKIVCAQIQ